MKKKLTLAIAVALLGSAQPPELVDSSEAAPIAGCWDLVVKTPALHPDLRGRFSFAVAGASLRGTVSFHGKAFDVRDGSIDGQRLRFSIDRSGEPARFEGELRGAELSGTMTESGRRLSWVATRCVPAK